MPQLNYVPNNGTLGAAAYAEDDLVVSRVYPDAQESRTVTVGGTATDGVYAFTLTGLPYGIPDIVASFTRAAAETNAAIATALAAVLAANDDFRSLFTLSNNGAGVLTITMRHFGLNFVVGSLTVTSPGTLVTALVTSGTVADLPLGVAVVRTGTGRNIRLPVSSDPAKDIDGITVLGSTGIKPLPADGSGASGTDGFAAASMVSVCKRGARWVRPETAVAVGDDVYVRTNATGTEQFGALRNSHDGVAQVLDVEATEVNSTRYELAISVRHRDTGELLASMNAVFLSDGSATETEISTALQADIDLNSDIGNYLTTSLSGSGDDQSLILTADSAAYEIIADSIEAGTITITQTVAGVLDTKRMIGWEWDSAAAANNLAIVRIK
jgi:hypothetical protein